ncbi:MAG: hypothetical protein K2Z81_01855, partial [Cyanobacteria bacterium]|nr:hypothetical protein [Cyanobacteriota bacterium]
DPVKAAGGQMEGAVLLAKVQQTYRKLATYRDQSSEASLFTDSQLLVLTRSYAREIDTMLSQTFRNPDSSENDAYTLNMTTISSASRSSSWIIRNGWTQYVNFPDRGSILTLHSPMWSQILNHLLTASDRSVDPYANKVKFSEIEFNGRRCYQASLAPGGVLWSQLMQGDLIIDRETFMILRIDSAHYGITRILPEPNAAIDPSVFEIPDDKSLPAGLPKPADLIKAFEDDQIKTGRDKPR